jgi:hypothetical protein
MPKVYNIKDGFPFGAVICDRTSPFGNPFIIGKDGTRSEVIDKFKKYIDNNEPLKRLIRESLKGVDLVCHCKPKACHCDYLLEIANNNPIF